MKKKLNTAFSTRQYMVSKDFEMYYYSDLDFREVAPHTHDYYEFYFFLEGNITIYIDDIPHKLSTGDVIYIPPEHSHYLTCGDRSLIYKRFVFWLSKAYVKQLADVSGCYTYMLERAQKQGRYSFHYDTVDFNALQYKAFQLIEESVSDHFGKEAKLTLGVNDLLLYLNRHYYEEEHKISQNEGHSLYEAILKLIDENLDKDISLDFLASRLYVNKYYISHIFKERLGLSIHQYIIKRRLAVCRDAFLCGEPVTRVYETYGFKDYSSFYRAFKKEYGMSPKEYKELHVALPLREG